ncbi:hypothetical protein FB451DRAFT_1411734 [Mycena latifolia]|nr:hypothetical protein FB451DRAFT_1411734 [Mycena latifolia]
MANSWNNPPTASKDSKCRTAHRICNKCPANVFLQSYGVVSSPPQSCASTPVPFGNLNLGISRHFKVHDLKSFSLVAQALLFPAQSLLFHDIELIVLLSDSRNERELSRYRRLSDTLKTSPHLAAHIRRLSVTADCEILSLISIFR